MKIHSALEAGGRVVKKETVTSWDRFQAQSIWGIPAKSAKVEVRLHAAHITVGWTAWTPDWQLIQSMSKGRWHER